MEGRNIQNRPRWIDPLLRDLNRDFASSEGFRILKESGRLMVFNICDMMSCRRYGIPGHACQILERTLSLRILHFHALEGREEREMIFNDLKLRLVLMTVSSVRLAAKMCASMRNSTAANVCNTLNCFGIRLNVQEVLDTEVEIYRTIDYRIPLRTSVEMGIELAADFSLPGEVIKICICFINFAELYRCEIEDRVLLVHNLRRKGLMEGIRSLHLAAAGVIASTMTLRLRGHRVPRLLTKISRYVQASRNYIESLTNIIYATVTGQLLNHPNINIFQIFYETHARMYEQYLTGCVNLEELTHWRLDDTDGE